MALVLCAKDDTNNANPREMAIARAMKFTLASDYFGRCGTLKQIPEIHHPARATGQWESVSISYYQRSLV